MNTDFRAVPDWFSYENAGAGIAVADLNGDGFPDLVVLQVDDPAGASSAYFRVGFGTDDQLTIGQWTAWSPVPDWDSWFNEGAGVAIADISGMDSRTCSSSGLTPSRTVRMPVTTGLVGISMQPVRLPGGRLGWRFRIGSRGSMPAPMSRSQMWTAMAFSTWSS